MIESQEQIDVASGNSLRLNQRRINQMFYEEDHKNLKTFHLKNQIDNDILVKDEQEEEQETFDYIQIMSDANRQSKLPITLGNNNTFNHKLEQYPSHSNININNNNVDDFTANWKLPSEAKRDGQKSITILNLQSMDETQKQMLLSKQLLFEQKIRIMNSPQAIENTQLFNFLPNSNNNNNNNNNNNINNQNESQQSIRPMLKSAFPYNIIQTANKLKQKLISKLDKFKNKNIQPIHLQMIDDWASSHNNHYSDFPYQIFNHDQISNQFNLHEKFLINDKYGKDNQNNNNNKILEDKQQQETQYLCCFKNKNNKKKQNYTEQQQQQENSKNSKSISHKQSESISYGESNSNFTNKKKIQNLLQSVRSLRDQPIITNNNHHHNNYKNHNSLTNHNNNYQYSKNKNNNNNNKNNQDKFQFKDGRRKQSLIETYSSILLMIVCMKEAINPSSIKRIIIDIISIIYTIIFYFFSTVNAVFNKQNNDSDNSEIINSIDFNENIQYYIAIIGVIIQLIDLLMNFLTGYYDNGIYQNDLNKGSIRYLKKGFFFDFISLLMLFYIIVSQQSNIICYLVYFLRIFSLYYHHINRIKSLFIIIIHKIIYKIISHFLSFLILLHAFTITFIRIGFNYSHNSWINSNQLTHAPSYQIYIYSLEWMSGSLLFQSMKGYNKSEKLFIVFTQIFSVFYFLYLLKEIFHISYFSKMKDITPEQILLKNYMPQRNVLYQTRISVKEYLKNKRRRIKQGYNERQIEQQLLRLPQFLKDDIIYQANSKIISNINILKIFTDKIKYNLAKCLQEQSLDSGQIVYFQGEQTDNHLYFLTKGEVELFYITEKRCKEDENYLIFQRIYPGQHFGESSFFTGMPRESYARCSSDTTLFKISREQFRESIEESKKDKEIFCEIRDDLLLENSHHLISQQCKVCQGDKHEVLNCPQLHYVPDREKILLQANSPQIQFRQTMKRKTPSKKANAWADQRQIEQCANKIEDNSTLYNKCVYDAINSSQEFYTNNNNNNQLNFSHADYDDNNNHLILKHNNHEDSFPQFDMNYINNHNNYEQQQIIKNMQSMDGFPSKYNLVSTEFDLFDKDFYSRRKSEHQNNMNTLNTTAKQRSFTKEEEQFFAEQKSGTSFLFPGRKDTSHAIGNSNNNYNQNSQGNILTSTQQEIAPSPIPLANGGNEQSFFSNNYKTKQQQLTKHNSNNFQNDELSQNTSINLYNQMASIPQNNQNSEFPQKIQSPDDTAMMDQLLFVQNQYQKDPPNIPSPNTLRNKKKNLTWNINEINNDIQTMANYPNSNIKGLISNGNNSHYSNTISNNNTPNNNNNNNTPSINNINNNGQVSNTNTNPLTISSYINNNNINNNNNNNINNNGNNTPQNYSQDQTLGQTSPNLTYSHSQRRITQTPKTLIQIQKQDSNHDTPKSLHLNHDHQYPKSDSNYSEQVQFQLSPLIEFPNQNNNILQNNRLSTIPTPSPSSNYQNNNASLNNNANNINSNSTNNNINQTNNNSNNNNNNNNNLIYNDLITEHSKLNKQTSTRKRTSSKFNDSQYKNDTDSQNSTSNFKKVALKKKNLTIIQESQPAYRNSNMKKSSIINQIHSSYNNSNMMNPLNQLEIEQSTSQFVPMATSVLYTNNLFNNNDNNNMNKKGKAKSIFNSQMILSSVDFQSIHPQMQQQLQQQQQQQYFQHQNNMFGELLPDQFDQSMLYSYYNNNINNNDKSRISQNLQKISLPKLSAVIPQFQNNNQFQQIQSNNQNYQNYQNYQYQMNSSSNTYDQFFSNMNGRLRKAIALKKIQNEQNNMYMILNSNQQDFGGYLRNNNCLIEIDGIHKMRQNNNNNSLHHNHNVNHHLNNNSPYQFITYLPKQDEQMECIKEFSFYKPHNNIKIILKQLEKQSKYNSRNQRYPSLLHAGNSFYVYTLKMKQKRLK